MPIFKLKKDELVHQWYRDYYEVEADTIEEAIEIATNAGSTLSDEYYIYGKITNISRQIRQYNFHGVNNEYENHKKF